MTAVQDQETFTGGNMDYNNFIFNSDTLYEQLIGEDTQSVIVSGSVPVYTASIFASPWTDLGSPDATVRGWATLAIQTYFPSVPSGADYMMPFYAVYDSVDFLDLICRIETSDTQYRCVVYVRNPYGTISAAPNTTVNFLVQRFISPNY